MDNQQKTEPNVGDLTLKYAFGVAILLFIGIGVFLITSPTTNPQKASKDETLNGTIGSIQGNWVLQPRDRNLSLNLATLGTTIMLNFLDSTYCNINVSSAAGNVTISRTYKIGSGQICFEDPLTGKIVKYDITNIDDGETQTFCLTDEKGVLLFKAYEYNKATYDLFNSDNSLKREEFLYPVLTPAERNYGETQVRNVDGRFAIIDDPNKEAISKIDVYELF